MTSPGAERVRLSALALAVLVLPRPAAPDDCPRVESDAVQERARRLLESAEKQQAAGLWEASEAPLRDAAHLDPASPFPPYALGLALMKRKAFGEAVLAFTASREAFGCLMGPDPESKLRLRRSLDQQLQQLRRTRAEYERNRLQRTIVKHQEVNNETPAPLGQSAQVVQALEARIGELQWLREHPTREPVAVALALGNAQFNAGALDAAELEFRKALASEPGNGDAHNNLAVTLTLLGRLDEAEQELQAAEKAGIAASPRIREEIRKRRAAGSS